MQPHGEMDMIRQQRDPGSGTIPVRQSRQNATACDFDKSTICSLPPLGMNQDHMKSKSISASRDRFVVRIRRPLFAFIQPASAVRTLNRHCRTIVPVVA